MTAISPTLLDKSAHDAGFELQDRPVGDWLAYSSAQTDLRIWLRSRETGAELAVGRSDVASALVDEGHARLDAAPPPRAAAVFGAPGRTELVDLIARAGQLARSLPTAPLDEYLTKTRDLPENTEIERLKKQRIGQEIFRDALLKYWRGRCPLTGLDEPLLLRASHIKPWAACDSNAERLDVHNGLLFAPHLDLAFDQGFISFSDEGDLLVSTVLSTANRLSLALDRAFPRLALTAAHRAYLAWHRDHVWRQP